MKKTIALVGTGLILGTGGTIAITQLNDENADTKTLEVQKVVEEEDILIQDSELESGNPDQYSDDLPTVRAIDIGDQMLWEAYPDIWEFLEVTKDKEDIYLFSDASKLEDKLISTFSSELVENDAYFYWSQHVLLFINQTEQSERKEYFDKLREVLNAVLGEKENIPQLAEEAKSIRESY